MEIENLMQDLKQQGLSGEQILQSLQKMVEEGKMNADDLEKAKQMLNPMNLEQEKVKAENLFGMKLI